MTIKGIIFIFIAAIGVIINFSSSRISEKFNVSQLKVKLTALLVVIVSITLLMIFGK